MGIFSFLKRKRYKSSTISGLPDIINAVIEASHCCAEFMTPEIKQHAVTKKERDKRFIDVYFEFFYFFMHHINRILLGMGNQNVIDRHLRMGGIYCAAAVKSIIGSDKELMNFSQADNEVMIKASQDILDKLNEREGQYAKCKNLCWNKEKPLDGIIGDSLLASLTRNIIIKCGYKMIDYNGVMVASNLVDNMIINTKVSDLFNNITKVINFESLVKAFIRDAR